MSSHQQYIDLFHAHRGILEAGSCAPMNARRDRAAAFLSDRGLPDTRVERYKYSNAVEAFAPDYGLNLNRLQKVEDAYQAFRCNVPNLSTSLYFVINDVVFPAPDRVEAEGVTITSICRAAAENPAFIEEYYHRAAGREGDPVTELNTMLAQDGILVHLAPGARPKHPIQIINISAAWCDMMSNRRILVVAEAGSEATLLFCDHADSRHAYLTTQVIEAYAAEGARLDFYSIEETEAKNVRYSQLYAEQGAGSRLSYNGITLACGHTRNTADVRLLGPQAEVVMNGAVILDAGQRVDNNILVDHAAESCTSSMLYKYVLDGQSVGAFAGKVLVREGAQHTASEQTNANICASPEARAYSQPMLEIYADDVKCNHGSTVGKLDESALFYMLQRGIPESEAQILLRHAFVNEVLRRIDNEHLRDRISQLVEQRFRGELSRCRDCSLCGK